MSKELFVTPKEHEGAGAYIDEIYNSLTTWVNDNDHPLQEYELLCLLKDLITTYFNREAKSND
jgi:hypothetical protein